ncbi:MAG: hypothetical protein NUW02_03710 [Candidatus Campbellbacteria bacterium]|nr:hypothetical protein [Candidatus Campbellbacteria bacterium]
MTKKQTTVLIVLGIILSIGHVIAIPLMWKEWISVLGGLFLLGWGLYLRYEKKSSTQPTDIQA